MSNHRARILLLVMLCAGAALAESPEPAAELARWQASAPVEQAIVAAQAYFEAQSSESRKAPRVMSVAVGAFTRPDVEQHAVLYHMGNVARGFPEMGLAVVEGDRLVHNAAFVLLAEDLSTLPDYDGSGIDALALEGGFGMGGQYSRGVTIAAFGSDGLVQLGEASLFESICGSRREGMPGPTSARLSVLAGAGVMIQRFTKATCESESWDPVGEPERLVLSPRDENPFVAIAVE